MRLEALEDRFQHGATGAHLVRHRRQADDHTLTGVAFGLPVKRLVLPKLLEGDHGQQVGTSPATTDNVEGRRRLADRLTVAAAELLADVLDDLPAPWDDLERLGDVLAQLGQSRAATACAGCGPGYDHPLTWQIIGEWLPGRPLAAECGDSGCLGYFPLSLEFVLCGRGLQLLELQFQLIDQTARTFRARAVDLALELLDLQLLPCDQRFGIGLLGACDGGLGLGCIGARTLRDERRFKHRDIVGQGCRIGLHKTDRITNRAGFVLLSRAKPQFDLTRGRRPPSQLWISPVDRFQQITHPGGCQRKDYVHRLGPSEAATIKALRIKG